MANKPYVYITFDVRVAGRPLPVDVTPERLRTVITEAIRTIYPNPDLDSDISVELDLTAGGPGVVTRYRSV